MTVDTYIMRTSDLWSQDSETTAAKIIGETLEAIDLPATLRGTDLEVSVNLSDDKGVQELNRDYRGKDKPTNVLSFEQYDPDMPSLPGEAIMLGDIVLAYETIEREAKEQEKSFADHFTHLLVHGTLHLLGYDHIDDEEAEEMEALEIKILAGFHIENPYKNDFAMPE
jgi:probable rRNA maturation factor